MEPEIKEFLQKVSLTILYTILWLSLHMIIGVKFNWAFFNESVQIGNLIYYFFLLITTTIFIKLMYKIWKKEFQQ